MLATGDSSMLATGLYFLGRHRISACPDLLPASRARLRLAEAVLPLALPVPWPWPLPSA